MPNPHKTKPKQNKSTQSDIANLELEKDAWPKFEKLIKSAAKMGPKPHMPKKKR